MKRIILIGIISISIFACKKENTEIKTATVEPEVVEVNLTYNDSLKPILFEYTSTGCPGCGSWGKPTFNTLVSEFNNKVVPLAVHIKYGDPMITPTSNAIADNRYGQYFTPQIWVNDTNGVQLGGGLINGTSSINYLRQLINGSNSTLIARVAGAIVSQSNSKAEVKVGISLLNQSNTNEYYLSCYSMRDGFVYNQTGSETNPTTHNYYIRSSAELPFGKKVELKNNIFEYSTTFEDNDININNYYVVILWQKQGSRYAPIGGYKFK